MKLCPAIPWERRTLDSYTDIVLKVDSIDLIKRKTQTPCNLSVMQQLRLHILVFQTEIKLKASGDKKKNKKQRKKQRAFEQSYIPSKFV